MWEVVAAVWGAAVAVALIVLGYAGYELSWKSARLRCDAQRLSSRRAELLGVQADLAAAQLRVAAAQQRLAGRYGGSRLHQAARGKPPLWAPDR